ncbi:hypothetical protein B9Z55_024954 [Caenorhabditis nigoni]|uniref:Ig-like domain-containing protein n=1 Tax=Caenorhabditis nigoni TaxID=1611254 RepID=A0A2G5SWM7_9PELO|nr:hypothetical protein B9Z55_024954 [Caenorhabditis nigoni]
MKGVLATESKKYAEMEKLLEMEEKQCKKIQPPTFVVQPSISIDGNCQTLGFCTTSCLKPTFVWKKLVEGGAKKKIVNSDRIQIVWEFLTRETRKVFWLGLKIKEPTIEDVGQYICTVRNKSGKLYATFNVDVPLFTEKPQNRKVMPDGKAPHFPRQPVTRKYYDESLELECFVDANPTPQVKWYHDNNLVNTDAGAYRCAIVNPHGKANANFTVELAGFSLPIFVEKPHISSRNDVDVRVMVMEFRAKSILEPTFMWQKLVGGGAEEIIAGSDRIKAVKKLEAGNVYYSALEINEPTGDKDAGQYICTVENESGTLTATFTPMFELPEGHPLFTRQPQLLQQTTSGGERAICLDVGYSAGINTQVTWISPKSEKMKESSRIKFKTNDEGSGNFTVQLELTKYTVKDSGTYTCLIKNDAGEIRFEQTLNIWGPLDDDANDGEN